MTEDIRLATRQSSLALTQARLVQDHICQIFDIAAPSLLPLKTTGDKQRNWSLSEQGGKGLFTKELEIALLEGRAQLAVHSAKDLPTQMDERLCIVAYLPRACAQDVLIYQSSLYKEALRTLGQQTLEAAQLMEFLKNKGASLTLATGSPRRREQIRRLLPQVQFVELRGNIVTRLDKIAVGPAQLTLLAAAGLERLGCLPRLGVHSVKLPLDWMVPAAGQGAIALQCRIEDRERWACLTHEPTHVAVEQERAVLAQKGGGCHIALGVHSTPERLWLFDPS